MIHTVQLRTFLPKEIFETIRTDKRYEFRYQKGKGYFTTKYVDHGLNEVKMTWYLNICINAVIGETSMIIKRL